MDSGIKFTNNKEKNKYVSEIVLDGISYYLDFLFFRREPYYHTIHLLTHAHSVPGSR